MTVEGRTAGAGLIARTKNILFSPKTEWEVIDHEPDTIGGIYSRYVLILAAIPAIVSLLIGLAVSSVIGGMFGGWVTAGLGPIVTVLNAVVSYAVSLIMVYVMALIIDGLAPTFGAERGRVQAFKVAAYSATAMWLAAIALFVPLLGALVLIGGAVYSGYLIYLGLRTVMKAPESQAIAYALVVIVVSHLAALLVQAVLRIPVRQMQAAGLWASHREDTVRLPHGVTVDVGHLKDAAKEIERITDDLEAKTTGGSGPSITADALQTVLPSTLPGGFARTELSSGGMNGLATGAEGVYMRGSSRIEINVLDSGALGAVGALAGGITQNRTTQTGYEKIGEVNGRLTIEEYDRPTNSGKYGVMVGNRFMVQAEGRGVTIADLKAAVEAVPFAQLEALAKG